MAEHKIKVPIFGATVDAVDVPITKGNETWNEYELEDGSVLRVKNVANSVLRMEQRNPTDGKPIYIVLTTPVVTVVSVPENLCQKTG